MSEFYHYMIGIEPTLEACAYGVDLKYDNGNWEWWEPGRPHSIPGQPAEAHPDGWFRIVRREGYPDIWFKEWGEWVWPYAPSVKGMTDEKAREWADDFWNAELDSGGG